MAADDLTIQVRAEGREIEEWAAGLGLWAALRQRFQVDDYATLSAHEFHEIALALGLMEEVAYQPEIHGEWEHLEPGDRIFVETALGRWMSDRVTRLGGPRGG